MPKELKLKKIAEQGNRRAVQALPKTYDKEKRTVRVTVASETPVTEIDWGRCEIVDRILLMDGMELPNNRKQVPALDTHSRWSISSILGSVSGFVTIESRKEGELSLASTDKAREAETLLGEGHLTDLSAGFGVREEIYIPKGKSAEVEGRTYKATERRALCVSTSWVLREVSLVPVGADVTAVVRSPEVMEELVERGLSANANEDEILEFIRKELGINQPSPTPRSTAMPEKTPEQLEQERQAAEAARKAAEKTAADEAQRIERERVKNINATAKRHAEDVDKMDELREQAINDGWTDEKFNGEILKRIAEKRTAGTPPAQPGGTPPANPNPPTAPERALTLNDIVKPWQRRAVHFLHAEVLRDRGDSDGERKYRALFDKERREMTEVQRNAEDTEAAALIFNSGLSKAQQYRLASSLSSGAGGALLPTPLLAEIFLLVETYGVARRYFRPVAMGQGDTLKLDSLVTKAVAYWVTQGNNIPASDMVFGQGSLTVGKLAGISSWTSELDEDAAIAWLPVFVQVMAEAIGIEEDKAGFIGDGTAAYGGFTGMLHASTNIVTMDAGKTAFIDAAAEDFKALRDAVKINQRVGAMFFLSPETVSHLEGLKDLQGRFIYREPSGNMPAMLWGYPIADNVGIEALTQSSAAAKKFAAYGNPKNILMGMKRQVEVTISREAILQDTDDSILYNAFQADGSLVKATERVGFKQVLTTTISVMKTAAS